jgi:hypothetical protein
MAAQSSSNGRDVYIYLLITDVGYPINDAEVIHNLRRKGTAACSPRGGRHRQSMPIGPKPGLNSSTTNPKRSGGDHESIYGFLTGYRGVIVATHEQRRTSRSGVEFRCRCKPFPHSGSSATTIETRRSFSDQHRGHHGDRSGNRRRWVTVAIFSRRTPATHRWWFPGKLARAN